MLTLGVTGLDEIIARLHAHGGTHEPVETCGDDVRHVEVRDPDGDSISLTERQRRRRDFRTFQTPAAGVGSVATIADRSTDAQGSHG